MYLNEAENNYKNDLQLARLNDNANVNNSINTWESEDEESEDDDEDEDDEDEDINYFDYEDEQEFEIIFKRTLETTKTNLHSSENVKTTLKYLFKLLKFYKLEHYMNDLIDNGYLNPISLNGLKQSDLDLFNVSPYDKKKFSKLQIFLRQVMSTLNAKTKINTKLNCNSNINININNNNNSCNYNNAFVFDPNELELLNENRKMFENIYEWQNSKSCLFNNNNSKKNKNQITKPIGKATLSTKNIYNNNQNNNNNINSKSTSTLSSTNEIENQIKQPDSLGSNSKSSLSSNTNQQTGQPFWSEIKSKQEATAESKTFQNQNMKRTVRTSAAMNTKDKRVSLSQRAKSIEPAAAKRALSLSKPPVPIGKS